MKSATLALMSPILALGINERKERQRGDGRLLLRIAQ
jgi:hypothetical protein